GEGGGCGAGEEALHRLFRRADARAAPFFADVRARRRQAVDDQREPARRGEGARGGEVETGALQAVAHQALEILGRPRLHARGNLLAQELEKQLGHQTVSSWLASQASHEALARSRTRRM